MKSQRILLFVLSLFILTIIVSACGDDKNNTSSGTNASLGTSSYNYSDMSLNNSSEISEAISDVSDISTNTSDTISNDISDTISDTSDVTSEPQISGALSAPYIKIINSGKYMLKVNTPELIGDRPVYSDITCYYKNNNFVFIIDKYSIETKTIVIGDYFYSFVDDEKLTIKSNINDLVKPNIPNLIDLVFINDGIDKLDNKTYNIENFRDTYGKTITFMYDGTILKKVKSFIISLNDYVIYDITIQSSYNDNIFNLPSDYTLVDLT